MARRKSTPWDTRKFENTHQIGGIRIARMAPDFGGDTENGVRVALVDTGSPLRFVVALDRAGDIFDASYNQHNIAYLTPNGLNPPNPAFNQNLDWLHNWPGGLLTSCGPLYIGHPQEIDGEQYGLHGRISNQPAKVEMCLNPDLHAGRREMLLSMLIRDSKQFGPTFEVRRQIQCVLGEPRIMLYDQITNRGDQPVPHNWLYHVNLGYPMLDEGARFIYRGKSEYWQMPDQPEKPLSKAALNRLKRVPAGLKEHRGFGERGLVVEVKPDRNGDCHVGLINNKLGLGFELSYPAEQLPRVANWQHYSPDGCYVSGIEPFNGSLFGYDNDKHPKAKLTIKPGQTLRYRMTIQVHEGRDALQKFAKYDGQVTAL